MFTSPVSSHHSDAGLDMASVVTFEGSVTEFTWRNPHIYFTVEARDGSGQQVEWTVQMGSTNTVTSMGWTRESLLIGDLVTVGVHAAHSGRPYGLLDSIEKEGGVILPTSRDSVSAEPRLAEPEVTVSTRTLDGLWMAKSSELVSYSGGFDGFFIANLELTEKGRDARAAYDPQSLENPEATCVGRPTPSMLASSHLYPIEIIFNDDETIVIRTDYWDETRTVYMDGRGHPDRSERFQTGHSIGSWDGDIRRIRTRRGMDTPSGTGKATRWSSTPWASMTGSGSILWGTRIPSSSTRSSAIRGPTSRLWKRSRRSSTRGPTRSPSPFSSTRHSAPDGTWWNTSATRTTRMWSTSAVRLPGSAGNTHGRRPTEK